MQYNTRTGNAIVGNAIRKDRPLSNEELFQHVPSLFAQEAWEHCSDRYAFVPTIEIIDKLRNEGFLPFMAVQSRTQDEIKKGYARHMVRLRHESQINAEEANEIILRNSHDKSSGFGIAAGLFRSVCQNGLVVGDLLQDIRIRHTGRQAIDNVIEGCFTVLENFVKVNESMEAMKATQLTLEEQVIFAKSALALRYDEGKEPVGPASILNPRRREDVGNDLWRVFNVCQDNLEKGGASGYTRKEGQTKRGTTRALTGLTQGLRFNKSLWILADEMLKLKSGGSRESYSR
jgi:hypothetical protein